VTNLVSRQFKLELSKILLLFLRNGIELWKIAFEFN